MQMAIFPVKFTTMKGGRLSDKKNLRIDLKNLRLSLSEKRRVKAASDLFSSLIPLLSPFSSILSFASFQSEIEMGAFNLYLAKEGRLLLPRMEGDFLEIYQVSDLSKQLASNSFGLLEPIPQLCQKVENIEVVLVPALGFDKNHHRIGYGKGFYDRFLSALPHALTIGVGFKEQLVDKLPIEETDYPLSELHLF